MVALNPGTPAPDFQLPGTDGKIYRLQDLLKGQGAILAFFKTECPTCQLHFPFVDRLYQRLKGTPIGFLAIGENTAEELEEFRQDYGLSMPMAMDAAPYPVSDEYGLTNVPTLYLIDKQGKIVKNSIGHSKDNLEALLNDASKLALTPKLSPIFTAADAGVRAFQPG